MSDDDMPPARPAPVPASSNRRVRVVPSSRRRPPLAPGTKAAADGGKQQKGATTASGRRSFLTLAVSTGELVSASQSAVGRQPRCAGLQQEAACRLWPTCQLHAWSF